MSAPPVPAGNETAASEATADRRRGNRKRKQPANDIGTAALPSRLVIPLRNKRLRKHAALIQTPTSGFLLCCTRNRETECMQSVLRLLQLYADEMYGEWVKGKEDDDVEDTAQTEEDDAEDDSHEVATAAQPSTAGEPAAHVTLQTQSAHKLTDASTGILSASRDDTDEGLAFIACNDPAVSTTNLTLRIFAHLRSHTLPLPLSHHLSRLLPIHTTASATAVHHIVSRFHHLTPHLSLASRRELAECGTQPVLTFAVVFRASNSRAVERGEAITALAARVEEEARKVGVSVAVRLVGADMTVLCWLVKSAAMLAVLPDYHKHCEYSIDKLTKLPTPAHAQTGASFTASANETTQLTAADDALIAS